MQVPSARAVNRGTSGMYSFGCERQSKEGASGRAEGAAHTMSIELPDFAATRILVAGEAVLDRYVMGVTDRISPEAPIPVLHVQGYEERPGNAAFVCANLAALGAAAVLLSVAGADYNGRRLRALLKKHGVESGALVEDARRPTIVKERLMGSVQSAQRATQQLLRVDHEDTRPLTERVERRLRERLETELDRVDGVLVCDIGKGMLTGGLLRGLIDGARQRKKPVIVDPRRTDDYSVYRGATALTPNRYETERATGLDLTSREAWEPAARRLIDSCALDACLITLDRDGVVVAQRGGRAAHVATRPREVYDVTGAGDVVLAIFGLLLCKGIDALEAAAAANAAAGVEVTRQGAAVISRSELMLALRHSGAGIPRKLLPIEQLAAELARHRGAGRRISLACGSFYPITGRHLEFLEFARRQSDLLVVAMAREDTGIEAARIIASLETVDYVIAAEDADIEAAIEAIRPDVMLEYEQRADPIATAATA